MAEKKTHRIDYRAPGFITARLVQTLLEESPVSLSRNRPFG